MKNIFIGTLIAITTFGANASMLEINGPLDEAFFNAEVQEDKTYFETLGGLYSTGRLPDLKKITNIAWAGRCFTKSEQSDPVNGGYIFRVSRSQDVGPLGRDKVSYEAATYWRPNQPTNFFDYLSLNDVYKMITDIKFFNVSLKSDSVEISHIANNISSLRLSGSYLVEEISSVDVGPLGRAKRSAHLRCYYFIPEISNQ